VTHIEQDSRGFIWLIAGDGISRFYGYSFINYTTDDGLPDRRVNDLLETRGGVYWMATEAGLCRFNPTGRRSRVAGPVARDKAGEAGGPLRAILDPDAPMFDVFNPTEKPLAFNALLEDEAGVIWCATGEGLYRLDISPNGDARFRPVDLETKTGGEAGTNATAVIKDRRGALWVGTRRGALYRLAADGRVERYGGEHGLPQMSDDRATILTLFEDRDGLIWVGTHGAGLYRLVAEPDVSRPVVARVYGTNDGLLSAWVNSLRQTRDGRLWVGTSNGLCLFSPEVDGRTPSFRAYTGRQGLCDDNVWDIMEDRDDNLWLASYCGVLRVAHYGFTGYGVDDGLANERINSIFENRDGELFVINGPGTIGADGSTGRRVNEFDGARFNTGAPNVPARVNYHGWGWAQTVIQDHLGEWWVPTGNGLFRFPKVGRVGELARARPRPVSTAGEDTGRTEVFRLYEDSRGDVWMATTGRHFGLLRWERATDVIHDHTAETGVPPNTDFTFFLEDRAGNLWVGTSEGGGLLRYRGGRFKRFTTADGLPPGWIIYLHLDRAGRLWVASQLGGLNRVDDPSADALRVVKYTTLEGLSSNNVRSITEDEWGRIYAGTGHGVDRIDTETGGVKHFTVADGLPRGIIEVAYRDRQGALWFGSWAGVARVVPEKQESRALPSVYITGLRAGGGGRRVSELGEVNPARLDLTPQQNQVSVDFTGIGATVGEELRYQYALEGAAGGWSTPTTERTINFASLAPGAYRFSVRAVNADGGASPTPATLAFSIAAPVRRRWWFLCLAALALSITAYALYRYRVARLLAVANLRTRIATDLHDDIGANLTRIAILSEVARRQYGDGGENGGAGTLSPLASIANISRESVASMSDIVWAISPERAPLLGLVRRIRRHAEDMFTTRDIALEFKAPVADEHLKLGVDVRRDLFLVFKEATVNAARHSRCTRVKVDLSADGAGILLRVADDGVGFDTSAESEGQGLMSMRRRALGLGGTLEVESRLGAGTTVRLLIPASRLRRAL
jgi:signal transduction histidine kinase/ligand-binding sensor domain-containing protein